MDRDTAVDNRVYSLSSGGLPDCETRFRGPEGGPRGAGHPAEPYRPTSPEWHTVVMDATPGPKRLPMGLGMVSPGLTWGRNRGSGPQ